MHMKTETHAEGQDPVTVATLMSKALQQSCHSCASSDSDSPRGVEADEACASQSGSDAEGMQGGSPVVPLLPGQKKLAFAPRQKCAPKTAQEPDLELTLPRDTVAQSCSAPSLSFATQLASIDLSGKWEVSASETSSASSSSSDTEDGAGDNGKHDPVLPAAGMADVGTPMPHNSPRQSRSRSPCRQQRKAGGRGSVTETRHDDPEPFLGWSKKRPTPPPGTHHWMQPLWNAVEKKLQAMPPLRRKVTLQSLCSGTAAELNAIEVQHGLPKPSQQPPSSPFRVLKLLGAKKRNGSGCRVCHCNTAATALLQENKGL